MNNLKDHCVGACTRVQDLVQSTSIMVGHWPSSDIVIGKAMRYFDKSFVKNIIW